MYNTYDFKPKIHNIVKFKKNISNYFLGSKEHKSIIFPKNAHKVQIY